MSELIVVHGGVICMILRGGVSQTGPYLRILRTVFDKSILV